MSAGYLYAAAAESGERETLPRSLIRRRREGSRRSIQNEEVYKSKVESFCVKKEINISEFDIQQAESYGVVYRLMRKCSRRDGFPSIF